MSNKTLQFRYQNKSITVITNAGYLGSHHWCATGVIHCVLVYTNRAVPISDGTSCLRGRKPYPKDAHWLCLRLSSTLKSYHRYIHSKRWPERNQKRLNQQECCANHYAVIFTWGCCKKLWDSNHTLQMCVWANGLAKCIFTQSKEKVHPSLPWRHWGFPSPSPLRRTGAGPSPRGEYRSAPAVQQPVLL